MTKHNNRPDAVSAGATFYNTGRECRYGHKSDRLASNGSCKECGRVRYKSLTPEKQAEQRGQSLERYHREQGAVVFNVHNLKM